jgi:hypothetical protein
MYKLIVSGTAYQVEGPIPHVGETINGVTSNSCTVVLVRHVLTHAGNDYAATVEIEAQ